MFPKSKKKLQKALFRDENILEQRVFGPSIPDAHTLKILHEYNIL